MVGRGHICTHTASRVVLECTFRNQKNRYFLVGHRGKAKVGVIDIIASAFHIKSDRMKDLQLIKDHPDYQSHEDDDSEE